MNLKLKLLILIIASSSMLIFANFILIVTIATIAFTLLIINKLQEKFIPWIKPLLLVFLIVIFLQSLTFSGLGLSLAGFYWGILYASRLLTLVTLVFLFVQTITISQLAETFNFLPVTLSQILILTLSLLPNMTELTEKIVNAQRARGLNFKSFNIFKTYFPILIPLFAKTLYRSEKMALAMQARGFENPS